MDNRETESPETQQGDTDGDAMVGSISHILRTLFRDLYANPVQAPGTRPSEPQIDEDVEEQKVEAPVVSPVADLEGNEGEPEVTPDSPRSPERGEDPEPEQSAESPEKMPEEQPAESASQESAEANEELEDAPPSPHSSTSPLEQAQAEREEEAVDSLTPHEKDAAAKMAKVDERLQRQRQECIMTLNLLKEARQIAAKKDKSEENRLKKQGILVSAHIPRGPSHLSNTLMGLSQQVPSSFRPGEASIVPTLISARELMEQNEAEYLYKSGNMVRPRSSQDKVSMPEDEPGYLKMTGSLSVRKEITIRTHERVLASKQRGGSAIRDTDDTLNDELRSMIDADMEEPPEQPSEPQRRKKKVIVNGEQHDLDERLLKRMDQKLKFTRNPRHDPANKNNHRLLTLPPAGASMGLLCPVAPPERGTEDVLTTWASRSRAPPKGDHGFFATDPHLIEFTEYRVGGVYHGKVLIRNMTAVTRTLTVLPLSTQFFSIESVEYPSKHAGTLAPGMAVRICVKFTPDSLADYEDHLTIRGEGGEFPVRVWAHREPPSLSIPLELDVGACLVGDAKTISFTCRNSGGPGRFRLLTPEDYPNPRTAQANNLALRLAPFNITPTEFQLDKEESVEINVDYVPLELGEHRVHFVMLCDNCQVTSYSVCGRAEQVELKVTELNHGQLGDSTVLRRLDFPCLALGSCDTQMMTLSNATPIDLHYRWELRRKHEPVSVGNALPAMSDDEAREEAPLDGFSVHPRHGVIAARSDVPCHVGFGPLTPSSVGANLVLVVESVPPPSIPSVDQQALLENLRLHGHGDWLRMQAWFNQLDTDGSGALTPSELKEAFQSLGLRSHKRAIREMMETLDSDGDGEVDVNEFMKGLPAEVKHTIESQLPRIPFEEIQRQIRCDVECIALTLEGAGEHVVMDVHPASMTVPGTLTCGSEFTRTVMLTNTSNAATTVTIGPPLLWSLSSPHTARGVPVDPAMCTCVVTPSSSRVRPGEGVECEVTVSFYKEGWTRVSIPVEAEGALEGSTFIHITAWSAGPRIQFSQPEIDMGLLAVGGSVEQELCFTNESEVECCWSLDHMEADNDGAASVSSDTITEADNFRIARSKAVISCEPASGLVGPGETVVTRVLCEAGKSAERVRATLECRVGGGIDGTRQYPSSSRYLRLRGEVQAPLVHLSASQLPLGVCYVGVPVRRTVRLINLSNLSASFKWERPMGEPGTFSLSFGKEQVGVLEEKQVLEVPIDFTARTTGALDEYYACRVFGMPHALGFRLTGTVKGLVVSYEQLFEETESIFEPLAAPDEPQFSGELPPVATAPKFDFGEAVPLFERRTLRFVVRNLSAIAAPFKITPSRYKVALDSHSYRGSIGELSAKRSLRRLLSNEHEETEAYQSEAGRKHIMKRIHAREDHRILSAGRGAAFAVSPSNGVLEPWGVVEVRVDAFNEMPGLYCDDLECVLEGTPMTRLSVRMRVVGCPLKLLGECVGIDVVSDPTLPRLRFGDVVVGSNDITKLVRVRNEGPIGAQVAWTVRDPKDDVQDDRLVCVSLERPPASSKARDAVTLRIQWRELTPYVPPYSVEPGRTLIKPHSDATFSVKLPSHAVTQDSTVTAMMSLDADWVTPAAQRHANSSSSVVSGQASGLDRHTAGAVRVLLTAQPIPPHLMLDKQVHTDKSGRQFLRFEAHSTRLPLRGEEAECDESQQRTVTLTNPLSVSVTVAISATNPFMILGTKCLAPPHPMSKELSDVFKVPPVLTSRQTNRGGIFTLPPQENVSLQMGYIPPRKRHSEREGMVNLSEGHEGVLNILFATGQSQQIHLVGSVLRPMIVCAPSEYDFGLVHTEAKASVVVYLSNPTQVDASWRVVHVPAVHPKRSVIAREMEPEPAYPDDDADVFGFSEYSGVQCGPALPLESAAACLPKDLNRSHRAVFKQAVTKVSWQEDTTLPSNILRKHEENPRTPRPIVISFRPKRNASYQSRYRFEVHRGEGFDLVLSGKGTYEEGTQPNPPPHIGPGMQGVDLHSSFQEHSR